MKSFSALLIVVACLLPTLGLAATVTLNPTADAYVQDGKNASKNYGSKTQLRVQTNATAASNYDSYLKFDTSAATGEIASAKLRLYVPLSKAGSVSTSVHAVGNTGWGETTLTWNNRPALGAALGSVAVNSTDYAWKEIDVTAYVQAEKAAGRSLLSLGLHNASTSSAYVRVNSRNAHSNRPELVIVTAPAANLPPSVSLTAPVAGSTFVSGEAIVITANAVDSDGSIASVAFYANGTLLTTVTGIPYKLTTSLAAGSYSLTAAATDNEGAVTTSAPVNITVTPPPNVAPTVSMTGPADGSTYAALASVNLSADASDSDSSIAIVEFYNGTTLIASLTTPPYTYTWSDVPVGNYSVRARAVDDRGGETYSNTIGVNVTVPPPVAAGVYYVYADHLNTPRVITDATNKIVWRWDSGPFGADAANEDPDGDGQTFRYNLRFPGQYYDRETGLHYNYFRDYDPGTGRYVQTDPIGLAGGVNLYAYVGGNPVSFTDPSGLVKWTGTFGGAAYIEGVGAGFFKFDLTSECKCGKIMRIKGYVPSVAAGLGMTATGSGGRISFSDYSPCPNSDVANGGFIMTAATSSVLGGGSCSKIALGGLNSSGCGGPVYGLDVSAGLYLGAAVVTSVEVRDCCDSK